jgi:hypothetical protein
MHKEAHHIVTESLPVRELISANWNPAKLSAIKQEFSKVEKESIIWRSSSCRSPPLHVVVMEDRTICVHVEVTKGHILLSNKTHNFHLISRTYISSKLHICKIFSKMDLRKGKFQKWCKRATSIRQWKTSFAECGNSVVCH